MRSKLLILFLFICVGSFAQSVPNTTTFSLSDVVGIVGGTSLSEAVYLSVDGYFDPTYKTNSYGTKNNQLNFRNYTVTTIVTPTVTTAATYDISTTSAGSGGTVTSAGGATITSMGICWATTYNPTTSNSHQSVTPTGVRAFTVYATSLTSSTTYHIRAYATNSAGTAYGSDVSFTTASSVTVPTVTTNATITDNAPYYFNYHYVCYVGGNVTATGGANVTSRGLCWSTTSNPTVSGSHTSSAIIAPGSGTFNDSISNLIPNTIYHFRAYAANSVGTSYGSDVTFTTCSRPSGLTTYNLALQKSISGVLTDFHSSFSAADQAMTELNTGVATVYTTLVSAVSISVGSAVYTNGASDFSCWYFMDGYFIYTASTPDQLIHVQNGHIVSISEYQVYSVYSFCYRLITSCGDISIISQATAEQACTDSHNGCTGTIYGTNYRVAIFEVGSQLYQNVSPYSSVTITGYYWVRVYGSTVDNYVVYVNNGLISSISLCP